MGPSEPSAFAVGDSWKRIEKAARLFGSGDYDRALRTFRKANKAAGGECVDCLLGMAVACRMLGKYDEAFEHAEQALELEPGPAAKVNAYNEKGLALYLRAATILPAQREDRFRGTPTARSTPEAAVSEIRQLLSDSEEALRAALAASGGSSYEVHNHLAEVLYRRYAYGASREILSDALGHLQEYVDREPVRNDRAEDLLRYLKSSLGPPFEVAPLKEDPRAARVDDVALETGLGDVLAPRKVFCPIPLYTREARETRIQGTVTVQAIIDKAGAVSPDRITR
jgi:tetratricopeptide (TPR) repeat protein